jgi:hypothetical protein
VNVRDRQEGGSIRARIIRRLQHLWHKSSRLTYGANDEAKLEESIVRSESVVTSFKVT